MRRAFTLIEVLITIALLAMLISILLPALGRAREAGRAAACGSNLRQITMACWQYADRHGGAGPAIGEPYGRLPNWGLVVQNYAGHAGENPGELYHNRSVLVCPTIASHYGRSSMNRTYAMNATGHAGPAMGDRRDYDDPNNPAFIQMDRVRFPSEMPLLLDSDLPPPTTSNPPPPTRTASMIDFRQELHRQTRIGRFHGGGRVFQVAVFDGSVRPHRDVPERWLLPLP